ncbi:hypothetical protein R3P38DRAFT_3231409 [Favolaschia claudopus]|uniref:Uncharacterized protein n=1 Tax=Favolaschia claudopus TaxID=2862362 RepID=A0AAV9ZKI7_9AGAR
MSGALAGAGSGGRASATRYIWFSLPSCRHSKKCIEQSRHISQIVQVLTQPPPSLFPVHSEEDSGLCSTTPAAPSPPEPDAITPDVIDDDVAPPRSSQPLSNSGALPSPANSR